MPNKPQDFFGSSPKTVLNKPFMHVQDQKPSGTDGGSSVAGWQTRDLNTVLHNDITGASLSGNQVALPAGTYYVEASAPAQYVRNHKIVIQRVNDNATLFIGTDEFSHDASGAVTAMTRSVCKGVITFSSSTTIRIQHHCTSAYSQGLGFAANIGELSVYSDLRIWQLDRSLEIAPVAINSGLQTVPGLDTTGNIMGFNLSKTGADEVTVSKGSCLDSTLTVPIALTADTAVAIPAVANTIYHVFVVKLVADGSMSVRAYTSEAGVASDGEVSEWRWVGFCRTNGASEICEFIMEGESYTFLLASEQRMLTVTGTNTLIPVDSFFPSSRVKEITVSAHNSQTTAQCNVGFYYNATATGGILGVANARSYVSDIDMYAWGYLYNDHSAWPTFSMPDQLYCKVIGSIVGTPYALVRSLKLRR